MTAVAIGGEAWEAPFAAATMRALPALAPAATEVVVPAELSSLANRPRARVLDEPPGRFRSFTEIVASIDERMDGREYRLLPSGQVAPGEEPIHRPPSPRRHRLRRLGALDVWTVDTGDGYFPALGRLGDVGGAPVWSAYGPGMQVFAVNTNDFGETSPTAHDDYVVLGSGLLGLRMIVESRPAADARVLTYDINPDQLAWSRFVVANAGDISTLAELTRRFEAESGATVRRSLDHELGNAEAQAEWYRSYRGPLAALPARIEMRWLRADLLNRPGAVLSWLRQDRSVFFMYLDLFVVWHVTDDPPWIAEFPALARSLEAEVTRRARSASFLPGPGSRTLQVDGSPLLGAMEGNRACT